MHERWRLTNGGNATEAIAIAELKRRNISVSLPFGDNERYDAIVAAPGDRMLRVQIKTGWMRDGCVEFHGKSQRTNSTGNTYSEYEGEVDYFIVYVPDRDSMYLIAEREFGTDMRLRLSEPERSRDTINRADEFRFDERWPPQSDDMGTATGSPTIQRAVSFLDEQELSVAKAVTIAESHLLVDTGDAVVRLGVKTGWVTNGRIRFHPRSKTDSDLIDWYFVFCDGLDSAYLVRPDEFETSISLRVSEPEEPMPSINWAEDYEFKSRWPY